MVFCATQDHAAAVRDLINQMKTSKDPNYCVRVTAKDGAMGDQFLGVSGQRKDDPDDPDDLAETSTGVDARNVRNIVLMRPIKSMIEFKQIIGRGTRLYEGKDYFTIYDFVKAYEHFNDPEWDGEPAGAGAARRARRGPAAERSRAGARRCRGGRTAAPKRIKIKLADGKERAIQPMTATTSGARTAGRCRRRNSSRACRRAARFFKDEDELRGIWSQPDTRKALLQGLAERASAASNWPRCGGSIDAENSDLFDVLAYIAFALAPVTRAQRAARKPPFYPRYETSYRASWISFWRNTSRRGVGEVD